MHSERKDGQEVTYLRVHPSLLYLFTVRMLRHLLHRNCLRFETSVLRIEDTAHQFPNHGKPDQGNLPSFGHRTRGSIPGAPQLIYAHTDVIPSLESKYTSLFNSSMLTPHPQRQCLSKQKRQSPPSAANSSNSPTMPPPPTAKWPSTSTSPRKPPRTPSTESPSSSTWPA